MKKWIVACMMALPGLTMAAGSSRPVHLTSNFGFKVTLPAGWVLIGRAQLAAKMSRLRADNPEFKSMDHKTMVEALKQMRNKQVELYIDTKYSVRPRNNTVNVELAPGRMDYSAPSEDALKAECRKLPHKIEGAFRSKVRFNSCGRSTSHGITYFHYSYAVASRKIFIDQYVVPFTAGRSLIVVGGCQEVSGKTAMIRVMDADKTIVHAITRYLAGKG